MDVWRIRFDGSPAAQVDAWAAQASARPNGQTRGEILRGFCMDGTSIRVTTFPSGTPLNQWARTAARVPLPLLPGMPFACATARLADGAPVRCAVMRRSGRSAQRVLRDFHRHGVVPDLLLVLDAVRAVLSGLGCLYESGMHHGNVTAKEVRENPLFFTGQSTCRFYLRGIEGAAKDDEQHTGMCRDMAAAADVLAEVSWGTAVVMGIAQKLRDGSLPGFPSPLCAILELEHGRPAP